MARIPIADIDTDMVTYPRKELHAATVAQYADALRGGVVLPPVLLEQGTTKLLSGLHRLEAYKQVAAQPELLENGHQPDSLIDVEYLAVPDGIPRKLFRASLDAKHGLRLKPGEMEVVAREVFTANPDFKEKDCAALLGTSAASVSGWVSDLLARRREQRMARAWRLSLLGWTQTQIADKIGVSQKLISLDLEKASAAKKLLDSALSSGLPVDEVAKRFNLPPLLVLAASLEEKGDQARMDALGWNIRPWDYWNWGDVDHRFGEEWDGRIPSQLVAHTLYFFSEPGHLVMDPMAGGGTVSDVCLVMNRHCRSYDMKVKPKERPEIEEWHWDPQAPTWPESCQAPDIIFFDPPYYLKQAEAYGNESISALPRDEYFAFFRNWATLAKQHSKPLTRLALLVADWRDFQSTPALQESPTKAVTIFDYVREVAPGGWELTHTIYAPLSSERFSAGMVAAMQKSRILGTTNRFLLMFRAR